MKQSEASNTLAPLSFAPGSAGEEQFNLLVVGAGPTGLACAIRNLPGTRLSWEPQSELLTFPDYTELVIVAIGIVVLGLLSNWAANAQIREPSPDTCSRSKPLHILLRPASPYIETRTAQQLLNFDLLVENRGSQPYHLVAIKLSVFDHANKLEKKRELNENGFPPALAAAGTLTLAAQSSIDLFQPFFAFDRNVHLSRLHFDLFFMREGRKALPVPFTADEIVSIDVHPLPFQPPAFCLPLRGLVLVHDGHDFNSHHRRFTQLPAFDAAADTFTSANLYAYDFVTTDASGKLYEGDPTDKHHWFTYGAVIYAPAGGVVLATANDVPENTFSPDGSAVIPSAATTQDPNNLGNHVTLKHPDGRVSWFLHMQPGSLTVKPGDHVIAGDHLGKVGFTGDTLFPHLHYTVTDAAAFPSQGVPSYFKNFIRVLGVRRISIHRGQVDTGDLIETSPHTCR